MIEFFIAKKHIMERKKQSIISVLGIVIGITVLIVSLSISNGLDGNMINNILSLSPHITIDNNGYYIENYEGILKDLEKINGVKGVIPTFNNQGILKTVGEDGSFASGVQIRGLDLKRAEKALDFKKIIVQGKVNHENYNEIIVGSEIFNQFELKLGDEVELTSAENKKIKLKVSGVFKTGNLDTDSATVIIPLVTSQIIAESGDVLRSIDITLTNPYDANKIISEVKSKTPNYSSRTWGEINEALLKALSLEKTVMLVLFSLLIIIAGFVIGIVLNTMVREKTKDIGIMRSMGYSRYSIMKIFLLEGIFLGALGISVGLGTSYVLMKLLKLGVFNKLTEVYYLTSIPVKISLKEVMIIVLATIFVILFSSIFPSYRASKLTPVEALKYE
ncbi:MAG: ABC transporter permease [Fusobacteriaceae bacterium]|nr:ABC transporter permease [Fusobacteriaceae bacterium]MBN2838728.1 ABC transporter permease [Fusobacteriaceae bacterium]